jgi:uncharacterized protein (TIGR02145 family)
VTLDPGFKYDPAKNPESLIAGSKLKETGTSYWLSPNNDATNETGFTGLPGGGRNYLGAYDDLRINGYWWSATGSTDSTGSNHAWFRTMSFDDGKVNRAILDKRSGISVRCIRD